MPPVLSSWAAGFAAQELMYRCEQHLSESGFLFLIFFRWCSTQRQIRITIALKTGKATAFPVFHATAASLPVYFMIESSSK